MVSVGVGVHVPITPDPQRPIVSQLGAYGPGSVSECSIEQARAYCVALAGHHPENFAVLSRFVPEGLRGDFAAVYAFCRWADDLGDEGPESERAGLLSWWRERLEAMGAGEADHPVTVALSQTVDAHRLPLEPFRALVGAFERDQVQTVYETWDDLLSYCKGSADPVGHLVLMLGGLRPPDEDASNAEIWEKSDCVCSALQITNHAQDLRVDLLERGRVYLPRDVTGFGEAELRDWAVRGDEPEARLPVIHGVRKVVDLTRAMYERAAGLPESAGEVGRAVWLMREGGRATLERIEAEGCATLWSRPRLGKLSKLLLGVRASMVRFGS